MKFVGNLSPHGLIALTVDRRLRKQSYSNHPFSEVRNVSFREATDSPTIILVYTPWDDGVYNQARIIPTPGNGVFTDSYYHLYRNQTKAPLIVTNLLSEFSVMKWESTKISRDGIPVNWRKFLELQGNKSTQNAWDFPAFLPVRILLVYFFYVAHRGSTSWDYGIRIMVMMPPSVL